MYVVKYPGGWKCGKIRRPEIRNFPFFCILPKANFHWSHNIIQKLYFIRKQHWCNEMYFLYLRRDEKRRKDLVGHYSPSFQHESYIKFSFNIFQMLRGWALHPLHLPGGKFFSRKIPRTSNNFPHRRHNLKVLYSTGLRTKRNKTKSRVINRRIAIALALVVKDQGKYH